VFNYITTTRRLSTIN